MGRFFCEKRKVQANGAGRSCLTTGRTSLGRTDQVEQVPPAPSGRRNAAAIPLRLFFAGCAQCSAKIGDEVLVFAFARCLIGLPKKRRWVNSRENPRRKFR